MSKRIELDDLYEVKRENDLKQLQTYNQILEKIHTKIRNISRQRQTPNTVCWFEV